MSKWIDLSDQLNGAGMAAVKAGQVLTFEFEGSRTSFKVMRKAKGRLWVKEIELYKPEAVEVVERDDS